VREIGPETRVARAPEAISQAVLGDTVVLDTRTDRYVRLNASAAAVWEAATEPATVAELAGRLANRFGLPEERALADTSALVRELEARNLVSLA
jgi:hypothetical protein